ncbi:hypothetical protein ACWD5V_05410 [Streptomyces sp. NPDC002523]
MPADPGGFFARRGRHRKPRPRKVLLAAGGLALAAGVLSLVRVAPESGLGRPGAAEAEPGHEPRAGGGADHSERTSATTTAATTALPSAGSAMGGMSAAPTGSAPAGRRPSATPTALPSGTAVPTTVPAGDPQPSDVPPSTAPTPPPATTPAPTTPAPSPSHGTSTPTPGDLCVPVIGLCVGLADGPEKPER